MRIGTIGGLLCLAGITAALAAPGAADADRPARTAVYGCGCPSGGSSDSTAPPTNPVSTITTSVPPSSPVSTITTSVPPSSPVSTITTSVPPSSPVSTITTSVPPSSPVTTSTVPDSSPVTTSTVPDSFSISASVDSRSPRTSSSATGGSGVDALSSTGFDRNTILGGGLVLFVAGLGLVVVARSGAGSGATPGAHRARRH